MRFCVSTLLHTTTTQKKNKRCCYCLCAACVVVVVVYVVVVVVVFSFAEKKRGVKTFNASLPIGCTPQTLNVRGVFRVFHEKKTKGKTTLTTTTGV